MELRRDSKLEAENRGLSGRAQYDSFAADLEVKQLQEEDSGLGGVEKRRMVEETETVLGF